MVLARDRAKTIAAERARYERDKDKRLAAKANYEATPRGRAVMKAARDQWSANNGEKRKAHNIVSNAIRDGRLVKGTVCEMADEDCRGRLEAHHDDYSKPLDVRWLCSLHHKAQHPQGKAA